MEEQRKPATPQLSLGGRIASFGVVLGIAMGLAYWFTGSLNPLDVFTAGSRGQVIAMSIVFFFLAVGLLGVLVAGLQKVTPKRGARRRQALAVINMVIPLTTILTLCYVFSGSLNPWQVFAEGTIVQIVVVSVVGVWFALSAIQALFVFLLIWRIERDAGESADDVYCKFCDSHIMADRGAFRMAIKCMHCDEWVHMDCWREHGGTIRGRCDDSHCRESTLEPSAEERLHQWRNMFDR